LRQVQFQGDWLLTAVKGEGAAVRMERVGQHRLSGYSHRLTGNKPGNRGRRLALSSVSK